jgi:hypothetical protein
VPTFTGPRPGVLLLLFELFELLDLFELLAVTPVGVDDKSIVIQASGTKRPETVALVRCGYGAIVDKNDDHRIGSSDQGSRRGVRAAEGTTTPGEHKNEVGGDVRTDDVVWFGFRMERRLKCLG